MNDQPIGPAAAPDASQAQAKQSALMARRRLLRGSVGMAPVLMVSAPRSVMAGMPCTTASVAATSVSPSGAALAGVPNCSGRLPAYWASCSLTEWPATCLHNPNQAKFFNDIFGSSDGYDQTRLKDVLRFAETIPKNRLAKYIVAAVLNARKGLTPTEILGESTVRAIWSACRTGSYYEPTAGVRWYADSSEPASSGGCIEWLKSTMS